MKNAFRSLRISLTSSSQLNQCVSHSQRANHKQHASHNQHEQSAQQVSRAQIFTLKTCAILLLALVLALSLSASSLLKKAQADQLQADPTPIGKIGVYLDSEATRPIDSEGQQPVYSVSDAVSAINQLGSTSFVKAIKLDLSADWNTKDVGRIEVGEGMTFYLNLHGYMLNRAKAGSYDDKWYAEGKGEVIYLKKNATLIVDGGTGDEALTQHTGIIEDNANFWSYNTSGTDSIYGGLITGGACDDKCGSGGISLSDEGAKAYLNNVTIAGNLTDQWDSSFGHGAGVALHGKNCTLELDNSKIIYNHAEGTGGGIYVRNDNCNITAKNGSKISNNLGVLGGGGIYIDGNSANLTFNNTEISNNNTHGNGGAIYNNCKEGSITISSDTSTDVDAKCAIDSNTAQKKGGAIYDCYDGTTINIKGSATTLSNNSSENSDGGAIYLEDKATLNVSDGAKITKNSASNNGGGIYVNDSNVSISFGKDTELSENKALTGDGGGIYHNGSSGTVKFSENAKLSKNIAYTDGGGIYNYYNGTSFTFSGTSTVLQNRAKTGNGGGFFLNDVTNVTFNDSATLEGNNAMTNGGAIYLDDNDCNITFNGNTIMRNNNAYYGGGIYNNDSSTKINLAGSATFTQNKAYYSGGAIYSVGSLTLSGNGASTKITNNISNRNGGGVWSYANLYINNITIEKSTLNNESIDTNDVYESCTSSDYGSSGYNFELNGSVVIGQLCLGNTDQEITGGTLEAGSRIHVDCDMRKIADGDLCSKVKDTYKDVIISSVEKHEVELQDDELMMVEKSTSRTVKLYNESGSVLLDSYTVSTSTTGALTEFSWDCSAYKSDGGKSLAWWDVKGAAENGKVYPDKNGKCTINIADSSVKAYAHYADTHICTVKYGTTGTYNLSIAAGAPVQLYSDDHKKDGNSRPSCWIVTASDGTSWNVVSNKSTNVATFTMPDCDVEAQATYSPDLKSMKLSIGESSSWADISSATVLGGDLSTSSLNSIVATGSDDTEHQVNVDQSGEDLGIVQRKVEDGASAETKNVTYTVTISRDTILNSGVDLPSSGEFNDIDASVAFVQSSAPVSATASVNIGSGGITFTISAIYEKPTANTYTVRIKSVNANDVNTVISTTGYQIGENETVDIDNPQIDGWMFYYWDETTLPDCATVDVVTGQLKITNPSADVEVKALLMQQASKLSITLDNLEPGKTLPTKLDSVKVTTFKDIDKTDEANEYLSISWQKIGSADVPIQVEANTTYNVTITFVCTDAGSAFDWADNAVATLNGEEVASFDIDSFNYKVTIKCVLSAGSDTRYDSVDNSELDNVSLIDEADYKNHLPATITYSLKNGETYSADITWSDTTEPIKNDDGLSVVGAFKVSGTFVDIYSEQHSVSRSFITNTFSAPSESIKSGTYAGTQKVELLRDATWKDIDDVKIYYALVPKMSPTPAASDYKLYSQAIDIEESSKLYFYAKYNDKESQARACFYDIKEERKLEVESGEALDINGSTINVAADGQTVCLSAKKMLNNMSFSRWSVTSSASVELKDASETETTFTMPDSDVSIKANYVEVAASASVVLPTLAVGDILPSTSKVTFKNSSGEVLDTLDDVALKWVKADGSILEAGAVAEANTSYIVSIEISLDKGAEFVLGEDIAVDFAGKAATSKTGPNNAGLVNATYKVELTNNSTPTPKAKTVKYKSCTYTLYGNTLRLTKVPKAKKKVVIPAKIKINGKKVKVKSIKKKVFKKTKVKKIVIKSPYLKKKGVKKSLKSSKVKIVKIKVYSKAKANKKQIKKYKRYFSKVNCGKKVKVK